MVVCDVGFVVLLVCAHTAPASRRVPDREELHCPLQVVPEEHLVRVRQALNLGAGEVARWHQSFSWARLLLHEEVLLLPLRVWA